MSTLPPVEDGSSIIAVQNWGPVYGGPVTRINDITNEPGSAANPKLLYSGRPVGDGRGFNQSWLRAWTGWTAARWGREGRWRQRQGRLLER